MYRHIYLLDKRRNHLVQLLVEDLDLGLVNDVIQCRVLLEEVFHHIIRHLLDQPTKIGRDMDFTNVADHICKTILVDERIKQTKQTLWYRAITLSRYFSKIS